MANNYNNKGRGSRGTGGETPVTFRDGQPVFNSEGGAKSAGSQQRSSYGKKPYERRNDNDKAPYGKKPYGRRNDNDSAPSYGKKPYERRNDNDSAPSYGKKPYERRNDNDSAPYGKKPYERRNDNDSAPYGKKPYERRNDNDSAPYGKKPYNRKGAPADGVRAEYGKKPFAKKEYDAERADTALPNAREDELPYLVMGRNAVREAIKSGRSIDRIFVSREPDGSLREIISLARDRNLRIDEVGREKLDSLCLPFGHGGKTGNHQGIVAQVPGVEYCEIADILAAAKAKNEKPFIILLDGIEDPHNLGSILRSAVCAGAHGVILPKRRAVSVTAAACKAAAGAVEYCKVARVANLAGAIDRLKDEGLWLAGADMNGTPMAEAKLEGAIGLVIGGEGNGISHLIREKCDFMVSIPMYGEIESLNASVAAAVLMFEKRRQDTKK